METLETRRTKIEEKSPLLLAALRKGYSISDSCVIAQIDRKTPYNWLKRAEEVDAPDEYVQFYCDFHEARAKGLEKLIKDLDRWDIETRTTVIDTIALVTDKNGDKVEQLLGRKITTRKKRSRASWFERTKFKLVSQYPDRWGPRSKPDDEILTDGESNGDSSQFNPFMKLVVGVQSIPDTSDS